MNHPAVHRTDSNNTNEDSTYVVETIEVLKGESGVEQEYAAGMNFDVAMAGNSGLCGIDLEIGEEYLIDLYRDDAGFRAVGLCGLTMAWSSISSADILIIEEGCDDYDACDGACSEYQVQGRITWRQAWSGRGRGGVQK